MEDDRPVACWRCGWPRSVHRWGFRCQLRPGYDQRMGEWIERWHAGAGPGVSLHEFLGMSWAEYALWVRSGQAPLPTPNQPNSRNSDTLG